MGLFSERRLEVLLRRIAEALEQQNKILMADLQHRTGSGGEVPELQPQRRRGISGLLDKLNSRARAGVADEDPAEPLAELIETSDEDYQRYEKLEQRWLEERGRLPEPEEDIEADL